MGTMWYYSVLCIVYFLTSYAEAAGNSTACAFKLPMQNFQNDDMTTTTYLIAEKKAFLLQTEQDICGTCKSTYLGNNKWHFNLTNQLPNGTLQVIQYDFLNSPPGVFTAFDSNGGNVFIFSIIGAQAGKFKIGYSCDFQTGEDGIWIFYTKRVQGFDNIDEKTKTKILAVLKDNNISTKDLTAVENTNCKN